MPPITFDLPGLPPSANKRLHYMVRHKSNQEWKGWANLAAKDAVSRLGIKDAPWDRVHILYIFHYPRRTKLDLDNAVGSCKPVLDGLKGILVVDDDHHHVHRIAAEVEVVSGQPAGIRVAIERCQCPESDEIT